MERLTNHFEYCDLVECKFRNAELAKMNQCDFFNMTNRDKCHDKKIYEKLREYEDLEEQGLLLKLPCKVGDAVYSWECGMIVKDFVYSFTKDKNGLWAINIHGGIIGLFGSSVFVTLEEAKKALAEMGE